MTFRPFPLLIALLLCTTALHAKDYAVIQKLPPRLSQVHLAGHKGWDSGVTPLMKEASYQENRALVEMIKDLRNAYFPEGYLTDKAIDEYLTALYTVRHFRQDSANPSGESQGTQAPLMVVSDVTSDLEETVVSMVEAIVEGDAKFDLKGWKKRWEQASKAGDQPVPRKK